VTVLSWLVLGGIASTVACGAASWRLPDGSALDRRSVGMVVVAFEITVLPGLLLAAAHLATRVNLLCPSDAECSAPYSAPALVLAPLLTLATVGVTRAGVRCSWPMRVLAPVLCGLAVAVLLLVLAGATYRIDVPRP